MRVNEYRVSATAVAKDGTTHSASAIVAGYTRNEVIKTARLQFRFFGPDQMTLEFLRQRRRTPGEVLLAQAKLPTWFQHF